ncbi:hypothetical protein UVI_02032600 [Ustilaginoidea virens]|uniref:Uncharacterized protein n=1 Tax=Ustilaginoidea virens TaxID=1159556 RepID=A0A1B5KUA4_USTVR|nr:hypothetical protein UVI_02032600 [Ustilaginoidea virens]
MVTVTFAASLNHRSQAADGTTPPCSTSKSPTLNVHVQACPGMSVGGPNARLLGGLSISDGRFLHRGDVQMSGELA